MQSPDISQILGSDLICRVDSSFFRGLGARGRKVLHTAVDAMGYRSAVAQGLPQPVTSLSWLLQHPDQTLYLAHGQDMVTGLLKVGRKKLFVLRLNGGMHEMETMCVLDFYTHETMQRQGLGLMLFQMMLRDHRVDPKSIGYDRPSPKLLNFLAKHFGLVEYVPQSTNFVVFEAAFSDSHRTPAPAQLEQIQRAVTPAGRRMLFDSGDPVAAQAERLVMYRQSPAPLRDGSATERAASRSSPLVPPDRVSPIRGSAVAPGQAYRVASPQRTPARPMTAPAPRHPEAQAGVWGGHPAVASAARGLAREQQMHRNGGYAAIHGSPRPAAPSMPPPAPREALSGSPAPREALSGSPAPREALSGSLAPREGGYAMRYGQRQLTPAEMYQLQVPHSSTQALHPTPHRSSFLPQGPDKVGQPSIRTLSADPSAPVVRPTLRPGMTGSQFRR